MDLSHDDVQVETIMQLLILLNVERQFNKINLCYKRVQNKPGYVVSIISSSKWQL